MKCIKFCYVAALLLSCITLSRISSAQNTNPDYTVAGPYYVTYYANPPLQANGLPVPGVTLTKSPIYAHVATALDGLQETLVVWSGMYIDYIGTGGSSLLLDMTGQIRGTRGDALGGAASSITGADLYGPGITATTNAAPGYNVTGGYISVWYPNYDGLPYLPDFSMSVSCHDGGASADAIVGWSSQ